jgi:PKD repeat protein
MMSKPQTWRGKTSTDSSKVTRIAVILIIGILAASIMAFIGQRASAQTYPTVSVTVYRVLEIDPIDLTLGDWDWYYYIGVLNGVWTWSFYEAPNGIDVIINETHDFQVYADKFTFSLVFCEGDFWTNDDRADVSSNPTGGSDDEANCIPSPGDVPTGAYVGTWDLVSESLSGDTTIVEMGYFKTSGDYDGSTGHDENDANVWFDVSDNYSPPIADAGSSKSGYLGDSHNFDASGSTASAGSSIESYAWDFDDDGSYDSSSKIDTWEYTTKGTHTIRLRVTDSLGVQAYDTTTVNVMNREPEATFTCSPLNATTDDDISFIDLSTDDDGTIDTWNWSFGDGEFSEIQNPTHRYASGGEYTVALKVTDNDGDEDEFSLLIVVEQIEEDGFGGFLDNWIWMLILLLFVIMVLIIVILVLRGRSRGPEYEPDSSTEQQPPVQ